jgi:queuosine precursor transporter
MNRTPALLCAAYILANTIANLALLAVAPAWRGVATIAIAAVLIGLDITARDRLHDIWHGDARRLGALIFCGAVLSALINLAALPIAIASCAAFALSGTADTIVYAALVRRSWYARVNGSNIVSAMVDSAAFLGIAAALGVLSWSVVPFALAGQALAKIVGGAAWAALLRRRRDPRGGVL